MKIIKDKNTKHKNRNNNKNTKNQQIIKQNTQKL